MKIHLVTALSLLTAATALAQGRVYVMEGATGDGSSWSSATGDLAGAMAEAVTGTEIWVAQGTYPTTTCLGACEEADRRMSFRLRRGVRVVGGFTGGEGDEAEANPANETILSGDIGTEGDPLDNAYNVVFCDDCGDAASMANLIITGGYANRSGVNVSTRGRAGAGVYLDGSDGRVASPTFTNVSIVNNDGFGQGGGVYIDGFDGGKASPRFERCVIAYNTARADGGGVFAFALDGEASPAFADTEIRNNGTVNPGGRSGQSGGGMYLSASNGTCAVTLDRCLLTRNAADVSVPGASNGNSSANGGGIYLAAGALNPALRLTIRNSVLSHNSAYSGGAIYDNRGYVTLTNVTCVGNRALGSGGSGGGVYINGGHARVANGLSYGNAVPNNPGAGRDFRFVNGALDVSYTLLEATSRAEAFSCSNAGCGNDAFEEGPGVIYGRNPLLADASADVPQLQVTSPALDAGAVAHASTLGGDFFGTPRVYGTSVDLGAVERAAAPLPVELVGFVASPTEAGPVELAWTSRSEVDLASYRVLRSERGAAEDFVEVGRVLAMGRGQYTHLDRAVRPGTTYYYRLRSVDTDGTSYDSEVASVTVPEAAGADVGDIFTRVFPNPTTGEVRVTLAPQATPRTVYATLFDASGRKLALWPLTADGDHVLSLRKFPDGQYVLRLVAGGREQSATVLVHH